MFTNIAVNGTTKFNTVYNKKGQVAYIFDVANNRKLVYTCDMDGIRTKKVVNGVTTEYFLNETTILAEKTGNDVIWYIYDANGEILGLIYNGESYYYLKNQEGDEKLWI